MTLTAAQRTLTPIEIFESRRAEFEPESLSAVFVLPTDFEMMAGMNALVVFGETGTGKTALKMALKRHVTPGDSAPSLLVVDWHPAIPTSGLSASEAVNTSLTQAFDKCAEALMRQVGHWPRAYAAAPAWAQETLRWFIQTYLQGVKDLRAERVAADCDQIGAMLVREQLALAARPILPIEASPAQVIVELTHALQQLHLQGVWLLVDGMESWLESDSESMGHLLKALLSTLNLFEASGFALKVMCPIELREEVESSAAVQRRRVATRELSWSTAQLIEMGERRLSLAFGHNPFQLSDLCADGGLLEWLETHGGQSPRGWLEMLSPLVKAYSAREQPRPLTAEEWKRLRQTQPAKPRLPAKHPPKLRIVSGRVFLGNQEVTDVPPRAYKMLRYLYEQRRICTRSELYYLVHRQLPQEPRNSQDPTWEMPSEWQTLVDNAILDLRKAIEPDFKHPIYVLTRRGRGIYLDNTR